MKISTLFIIPLLTKIRNIIHECYYNSDCMLPMTCCLGAINKCCIQPNKKLQYIPIYPSNNLNIPIHP